MGVSAELLERLPEGQPVTTLAASERTGIAHPLVKARMGWLHRRGDIEYLGDEQCDPRLGGSYPVGTYRRREKG